MSLNPLAPAFLPHYQFPSDPHISLSNSTAMCLPLAQIFCGQMPPSVNPSLAPRLRQPITDDTFILTLIQPKNPSKQDAGTLQPLPGSSCSLPSPLQHQLQYLQAITRPFNSSTNNWRQDNSTKGYYKLLSFNFRMTLHYCATFFSLQLEQFQSATLPLRTPLSVHQLVLTLTLTLTLFQMHSWFPALTTLQFVVLPRRALWDHPEWNQTTQQMSTLRLQPAVGMAPNYCTESLIKKC